MVTYRKKHFSQEKQRFDLMFYTQPQKNSKNTYKYSQQKMLA